MMTAIVPHDSSDQSRYTAAMNAKKPQLNPMLKIVLDLGPLVLFFVANSRPALFLPLVAPILPADIATGERAGIFVATAVFMVAIVAALVVSYVMTRHLPVMPMVTAIIVLVFGSLTLVLHDEHFIKLKPTIIYLLFGAVLLLALAILNEIVWRTQTTDVWVSFKVFGVVPLTFLFGALQYPLLTKYAAPEAKEAGE